MDTWERNVMDKMNQELAAYFGHDIDVFCTDDGGIRVSKQNTISGSIPCPSGKPNCCASCPVDIKYQHQTGLPFSFTRKLGEGGFASVFVGTWNNEEAAFKTIPTKRDGKEYTTNSNGPYEMYMQMKQHGKYPDLVDKPKGHFFIEAEDNLFFCLVMKKHRSNLYQMNKSGLLSEDNKKKVVMRLVEFAEDSWNLCHGDIKPENILVSYELVSGAVTNFEFKLADWGTSGRNRSFYGGTPGYASNKMFSEENKDLFSIGRLAMELYVSKTDRLLLCYYPIENRELLDKYRSMIKNFPFLKAAQDIFTSVHTVRINNPDAMKRFILSMGNVSFPPDFWDDLRSEVGYTDEVYQNHMLLEKLTRFQHYAEFKRTSKLVQRYSFENPMISLDVHDQGSDSFTCWAFSAASMIGNSCRVLVNDLKKKELIDQRRHDFCMRFVNGSNFHTETRNMIMMILMPRQLHIDDESDAAFLRAAVSRLVNPTILDGIGIFYSELVCGLISYNSGLGLNVYTDIKVFYRTYYNNHSPDFKSGFRPLIEEAASKNLCPVAGVDISTFPNRLSGYGTHAMVLDTIKDGKFVFKNSFVENKQVTIPVEKGPLEFYFLHIELSENGLHRIKGLL